MRINLLPAHRRETLRCRRHLGMWLAVLMAYGVLLVSACVGARVVWGGNTGVDEQEVEAAGRRIREAESALDASGKELASLQARKRTVSVLVDQPAWAEFLQLIGNRLGPGLVLRELKLTNVAPAGAGPKTPTSTAPAPARLYKLELKGLARSQSNLREYISALEETGLFEEVRLLRTGREPFLSGAAASFELECRLVDRGDH